MWKVDFLNHLKDDLENKCTSQIIQTTDTSILFPLNYTIWLLRLETPHRQPRKPMTIWLSPNRSSRIPTSNRPKNTEKWISLCLFSSELKCKLDALQPLAMTSLLVGFLKPVGGIQESLKNHCKLKSSGWMSLKSKRYKSGVQKITDQRNVALCP